MSDERDEREEVSGKGSGRAAVILGTIFAIALVSAVFFLIAYVSGNLFFGGDESESAGSSVDGGATSAIIPADAPASEVDGLRIVGTSPSVELSTGTQVTYDITNVDADGPTEWLISLDASADPVLFDTLGGSAGEGRVMEDFESAQRVSGDVTVSVAPFALDAGGTTSVLLSSFDEGDTVSLTWTLTPDLKASAGYRATFAPSLSMYGYDGGFPAIADDGTPDGGWAEGRPVTFDCPPTIVVG